jgi:hypothetical protein
MGLFGDEEPKVVTGTPTTIILYNSVTTWKQNHITDTIVNKANGLRTFNYRGYHLEFDIDINIEKFATPGTKLNELLGLLYTEVTFFLHKDGISIRDSSNVAVPFFVAEVNPYYLETKDYYDKCLMMLKSTKFCDWTKSILP